MKHRYSTRMSLLAVLGMLALAACMRIDRKSMTIAVPEMGSAKQVRIVTNAALEEVIGHYDAFRHEYEIDLTRGIVLYHEGDQLLSAAYRQRIEKSLSQVGFVARIVSVAFNPPPPRLTPQGWLQRWSDRRTAVIHVPDMKTAQDANIVEDAIAYARTGDHPSVVANAATREIHITYDPMKVARKNVEQAIAGVGFAAGDTPALLGMPDALPLGWESVDAGRL